MRGVRIIIVVLLMAVSLLAILYFAQNSRDEKGVYQLIGIFPNSAGLTTGQEITCLGQKIGRIEKTELQLHVRRIVIVMMIKNNIRIPVGSLLEVDINSLLGSKNLKIIPPTDPGHDVFCQSNDTLWGQTPTTLNEIQNKLSRLIDTATSKINQLNVSDFNQTMATIQHAAGQIDAVAQGLRPQLDSTINNANQLIKTYRQAGEKIETTVVAIDSLVRKGSKGIDSLPILIQETRGTVRKLQAVGDFFQGLKRFFGFHD